MMIPAHGWRLSPLSSRSRPAATRPDRRPSSRSIPAPCASRSPERRRRTGFEAFGDFRDLLAADTGELSLLGPHETDNL